MKKKAKGGSKKHQGAAASSVRVGNPFMTTETPQELQIQGQQGEIPNTNKGPRNYWSRSAEGEKLLELTKEGIENDNRMMEQTGLFGMLRYIGMLHHAVVEGLNHSNPRLMPKKQRANYIATCADIRRLGNIFSLIAMRLSKPADAVAEILGAMLQHPQILMDTVNRAMEETDPIKRIAILKFGVEAALTPSEELMTQVASHDVMDADASKKQEAMEKAVRLQLDLESAHAYQPKCKKCGRVLLVETQEGLCGVCGMEQTDEG